MRRWIVGSGFTAAVVAAVAFASFHAGAARRACNDALRDRKFADAAGLCASAYEQHHSGELAASAAMASLGTSKLDDAWKWANLPEAFELPRARRVRGVVLKTRGDTKQAEAELQRALSDALAASIPDEASRAAHALAGLEWEQGHYSAAWDSLEIAEREAKRANDGPALALAELARGDVLREIGDGRRADEYFRRALEDSKPWPIDHATTLLRVGLTFKDRGAYAVAQDHFQRALALVEPSGAPWLVNALRIDLAEAMALQGDAEGAAKISATVDPKWQRRDIPYVEARIALLRHDGARAVRLLLEAEKFKGSGDTQWEITSLRGDAEKVAGDPKAAEDAWAQAIDEVETLSASEPEHQGWVVARRRRPYDLLFASLAGRGDHARAWDVVARYVSSEALSFTGSGTGDTRSDLASAEALKAHWKEDASADARAVPAGPDPRELLVLHEAEGHLWIGRKIHGVPRWIDAGPLDQFDPLLRRYIGSPDDREAAEQLGEALWRAAELTPSDSPLYVCATGRLRGVAFSALRANGQYWFQLRPIARLATLAPPAPGSTPFGEATVIVGDPGGDLPGARDELGWLASRLNARALVGDGATRQAVLASRNGALLHLATHSELGLEGSRLKLVDGELSADEILRERPNARLVVLASCASAAGRDAGGSDSLTTAFLRAGSGFVLGTLRTVPDRAAQELVRAFYEEGGDRDPVQALARAQARVVTDQPASVWSSFVIWVGRQGPVVVAPPD